MIGLFFEQSKGGAVVVIRPVDPTLFQIFTERSDGAEKFTLLDGECADGELDRGALLKQNESFEHGDRILAAGKGDGDAVTVANHLKFRDRFADFA